MDNGVIRCFLNNAIYVLGNLFRKSNALGYLQHGQRKCQLHPEEEYPGGIGGGRFLFGAREHFQFALSLQALQAHNGLINRANTPLNAWISGQLLRSYERRTGARVGSCSVGARLSFPLN